MVPTGYGYVLPDQNGWSRYLHFQTAWVLVLTGLLYGICLFTGHLRSLLPARADLSPRALWAVVANHLRFKPPSEAEAQSYNVLQRLTYLVVIFVLFPLIVWTGLAMSPAVSQHFRRSSPHWAASNPPARFTSSSLRLLVLFLVVHVAMICLAGFWTRTRAMITGRIGKEKERS